MSAGYIERMTRTRQLAKARHAVELATGLYVKPSKRPGFVKRARVNGDRSKPLEPVGVVDRNGVTRRKALQAKERPSTGLVGAAQADPARDQPKAVTGRRNKSLGQPEPPKQNRGCKARPKNNKGNGGSRPYVQWCSKK